MSTQSVLPITKISPDKEQHMLLLFLPIKPAKKPEAEFHKLFAAAAPPAPAPVDNRGLTGVHFFMIYRMSAGEQSRIVVPTFTVAPPGANNSVIQPVIVHALDGIVDSMDESGIVPDTDTSSAVYIKANKGVANNADGFYKLLMRYNFADPTVPAIGPGGVANVPKPQWPYVLAATFPGLTVGMMLKPITGYPNALQLWPTPGAAPAIFYDPSKPPG